MNWLLTYILVFCMLAFASAESAFSQNKGNDNASIDFFKNPKGLKPGYHKLSKLQKTSYNFFPKLMCDEVGRGYFEVICFPKKFNEWQVRIKYVQDSLRSIKKITNEGAIINPVIKKIATEKELQGKFSIYAFQRKMLLMSRI